MLHPRGHVGEPRLMVIAGIDHIYPDLPGIAVTLIAPTQIFIIRRDIGVGIEQRGAYAVGQQRLYNCR